MDDTLDNRNLFQSDLVRSKDSNLKLVFSVVRRFAYRFGRDYSEFLGAGYEGLDSALRNYDPERGDFESYAKKCINGFILRSLRKSATEKRSIFLSTPVANDLELEDILSVPAVTFEDADVLVNSFSRTLFLPIERAILFERLYADHPCSREDFMERYKISMCKLKSREASIRSKLRNYVAEQGYPLIH